MGAIWGLIEGLEAFVRGRDKTYLVFAAAIALFFLWFILAVVQSLWGVIMILAMAAGLGYLAERFYPAPHSYGMVGSTVTGLIGAWAGQRLIGPFGPKILGAYIIPAFAGILLVNWGLRSLRLAGRARTLEKYNARGRGEDRVIGSKIEDYRIVSRLGVGGSAKVYRAIPDRTLNEDEPIAIKVFNEESTSDAEFGNRLQREIDLVKKLNHPRIVKVFKTGEQDGLRYMLMEFVDGEPLSKYLTTHGFLSLPETVDLCIELSRVLAYAHTLSVIHRDIKPDNIMMTKSGPRLLDFGLARPEGQSSLTQTGSALGTPSYMSPEQIRDDKLVDGRADQYALGCVLFELMTGQRPFISEQSVQVMMKHLNEPLQDPRKLNPDIPDLLARTVWHMMAKNPDDRFPHMNAVTAQLEQCKAELAAKF